MQHKLTNFALSPELLVHSFNEQQWNSLLNKGYKGKQGMKDQNENLNILADGAENQWQIK